MSYLKGVPQYTACRLQEVLFLDGKSVINQFEKNDELQFDSFWLSSQRIDAGVIHKADYKLQMSLQYVYFPACVPNEGQFSLLECNFDDLLGFLHDDGSIKLRMI